jgi:ribosomal protein L11 methyltransferase
VEPLLARVHAATAALPPAEVARRDRHEDEWRDAWKRHFTARRIGRFVLVPSWERYQAEPGEVRIDLDPGRAFGTGGHASTRVCLQALDGLAPAHRFLDVGCGSGVLAIACARAWPEARGVGTDVDLDAVEVSRENALRNEVADRIVFVQAPAEEADEPFDVITANIQPEVLIPMAGWLAAHLAPNGHLVLSGILVEAAPPVEDAFRAFGLSVARRLDEEGWRALVLAQAG